MYEKQEGTNNIQISSLRTTSGKIKKESQKFLKRTLIKTQKSERKKNLERKEVNLAV